MQKFEVVFSGQMLPGADPQQARQGLQRLFNASEAVLEQFFSGRRIVVKRDLDATGAEKYRQAFERAGAVLEVVASAAPERQAVAMAETASVVAAATSGAALLQVTPRDEYMAAFAHVQAPDFGLAEAGEDLLVNKPEQPVTAVDVSAISLAPAGSDLGQTPMAAAPLAPDTSHLTIENID